MNNSYLTTTKNLLVKNVITLLFVLFTSTLFSQGTTCGTATPITINGTCLTSTSNNITDTTQNLPNIGTCAGTFAREGWYTFTVTGGPLNITITAEANNRNLFLQLISSASACTTLTQIDCANNTNSNGTQTETITRSLNNGTYYVKVVNVGSNDMRLNSICVTSATPAYCSYATTNSSYWISNFTTTGGSTNINRTSTYTAGGYANYSATDIVTQNPGNSFNFNATTGGGGTHGINIWVDWNNDFDFADAGEKVYASGAYVSTATGTITIPGATAAGNYRMRIVANWLATDPVSCGSTTYTEAEDYTINVLALTPCAGTPTAGTTTTSPVSGSPGSNYTVSASGYTGATGLTFQWQYSTNGGSTWTNQGAATGTYSNYIATAPAVGVTTLWHLIVTCTSSGQSATSTNGTFTSVSTLNVPTTGSNNVTCGTNIVLYDNGGPSGDYANSSTGHTVLEAGLGATINISGNFVTEFADDIIIYNGVGTGGTVLATYAGTGSINYTGAVGQTLTVQFTSDSSVAYSGFSLSVTYSGTCFPACTGTPIGGTVTTSPTSGSPGSNYTVSATGYTGATGLTFQWQYSTNGGSTWTNQGAATGTYSNYTATAPALGTTVLWHLIVTCTASSQSATSTNGTFTSVSTINVPATGNNNVACGTNIALYDNGGATGDYANSSNGYTILNAGIGATINISGNYVTESLDYIRIYSGAGTGGTLLATYSGSSGGTINYTGTPGQTLTVQFTSDGSVVYSGFSLSVTYSGVCTPVACTGTPSAGTITTNPNTAWPGSAYVVSSTGYTQALNLTFQWQYSTDAGTTWTNAGAATGTYANYNATAPASGDVHWQLIVTCTNSGQSASSTGIFVTMEVSDVVTGCPSVISGGLGLSGADPAPFNCSDASTCVDLEATYLNLGDTSSYIAEPITYNPPFAFSGLANPVSVNTDDVWSPIVNLPFDFCFYGNTYTQCLIGSNGIITFDTSINNSPGGYCGWSMYSSTAANIPVSGHDALVENSIFGVFQDIDPGDGGEVGWELITLPSGCRALVASWSDVPMFSSSCSSQLYTGMIVLYENSNIIEVYTQEKNVCSTWNDGNAVIGIQNASGTLATVPPGRNALDANWTVTNEAWRFVPNGTSITSLQWHEGSGVSGPVVGTTDVINVCPATTTIYTAEITYTLCDGSTITETEETTVTVNGAKVWNGSVSTAWNNNNNWTPTGRPTALDCVVIPDVTNQPIISGTGYNGLGLNMSIQNGADLTVNSNNAVTITDWVTMNTSGNLILQNSASLIQVNNVANTGTMNMGRTAITSSTLDYVYWSSPVNSFNVNNITPASTFKYEWTPTVNNSGAYLGNFGNWSNASGAMTIGKGYIVRGSSGNSTFTGIPNNGNITTPISRGTYAGSNYTGPTSTMVTQDDDNWNLIGNPYPSALNAIDFLTLNTNIDGFVKIWTHGTLPVSAVDPFYQDFVYNYTLSDYITYNSSGASSGPGVFGGSIAAAQGFFVSMLHSSAATSETVQFNNSMRSHLYNNSAFYRSTEGNTLDKNRIWLDLIAPNQSNVRTLVGYIDTATNGRDRLFDAITDNKTDLNLYSQIGNELFTIQGKATPFNDNDFINLGVKVPASGIYSISIAAVDGLFENTNQDIYIEDIENNIIHDLRAAPYSFNITEGDNTNRFVLRFKNNRLSNEEIEEIENNIWVVSNDILTVQSTQNSIKSITIHDVIGRLISKKDNVNANEFSFSTLQKNNTTLLLKIELNNGIIVNKKVLF